jgi:ATP-binding cassette, subfamily C (CFTR/MRP), member 1
LVEQKPYILSKTIRENILFEEELDEERYNKVIDICQLGKDLEILEGGDLTQIGEKGINLSGGQKARLSIARAVYANKDIVLMDDPLSALDAHVKKEIFDKVCCNELKLKTRILVTHAVDFLNKVDRIIVMNKGRIEMDGTFEELKERPYFKKVLKTIHKTEEKEYEEEDSQNEVKEKKNFMSEKEHKLIEDEDSQEVNITWSTYKKFFSYSKFPFFLISIWVVILSIERLVDLYVRYLTLEWVKNFSTTKEIAIGVIFFIFGLYVLKIVWDTVEAFIEIVACFLIDKTLFNKMIEIVMHAPVNLFFDTTPSGVILNRFERDLDVVTKCLPMDIKWQLKNSVAVLTTIWYVGYYAPFWLFILPITAGLFYITLSGYMTANKEFSRLSKLEGSPIYTHISETIEGVSTIRTYQKIQEFENRHFELLDRSYNIHLLNKGLNGWLCMRLNFISVLFIALSYLHCIFNREDTNTIMVGLMLGYLIDLQWDLNLVIHHANYILTGMVSFDRWMKMFDIPQEAEQRKEIPLDQNSQPWMSKGHIRFNNYSVRYRPDTEVVLRNIDLDIQPGEKVGVVGRTGAGKSTLWLALCRIIERLDGCLSIDGVDISSVGLADLRDRITIIPQEPVLFKNTLRFNLDPEHKLSDQELIKIIEKAGLEHLLKRDGNGIDFKITEKGGNLSAGEKAVICICRAALRKNKVVLMDEATANIDVNTEETIQKLILEEFKEATVLTVAHRLNTIMHSDKILVMGEGKVVEFDTPEALKSDKSTAFYELLSKFNK